jgi:hypothetical protein
MRFLAMAGVCPLKGHPHTNTKCRLKRHLIFTPTHEHDSPTEAKPDRTIYTQRVKRTGILLDPKLYSKVLSIYGSEIPN